MSWAELVLLLVLAERLGELWLSRRNTERLLAQGAVEYGAAHYPWIVLLHAAWLAALIFGHDPARPLNLYWLGLFGLLQLARAWVMVSLGRLWTTRIISLAETPLVVKGPYRYLRHPNYWVVVGELVILPLALGMWPISAIFGPLKLLLLRERIRIEEEALAARRGPV